MLAGATCPVRSAAAAEGRPRRFVRRHIDPLVGFACARAIAAAIGGDRAEAALLLAGARQRVVHLGGSCIQRNLIDRICVQAERDAHRGRDVRC